MQALRATGRLQGGAISALGWCLQGNLRHCTRPQVCKHGQIVLRMINT